MNETTDDLCFTSATELRRRLRAKELSCTEVMQAHVERLEQTNPLLNAIVTFQPERALEQAAVADEALARGHVQGPLHGLPIAHKDLVNTVGVRTTYGSPIYKDFVPDADDLLVTRLKTAGAISLGKTNTPEFGAGSQTFNEVFGVTRNPYDPSKTCGGSSGGAAVALVSGMVPLADGSDMGGSLRNPAAFCNVVGFRPTPGRVPNVPTTSAWATLSVSGPMARTVEDVALLLSAMAGPDPRSPLSRPEDPRQFAQPLARDFTNTRVAWCLDFAGLPFDPRVTAALEPLARVFSDLGCILDTPQPDFSGADEAFKTFRAHAFAAKFHPLLETHRDLLKDTVVWNIEQGLKLSALDLAHAEEARTELFVRFAEFMKTYDYLVLPVTQVPPFDLNQPYPSEINGVTMDTYIDWMKSCYYISTVGNPAISVPAAFTEDGLPVGLQIVGRYGRDLEVLQLAYAFEGATRVGDRRPPLKNLQP